MGGWADVGVDAGAYARELMSEAMKAVEGEGQGKGGPVDPLQALETAHAKTMSQGSSTACLVLLNDQVRRAPAWGEPAKRMPGCEARGASSKQHEAVPRKQRGRGHLRLCHKWALLCCTMP